MTTPTTFSVTRCDICTDHAGSQRQLDALQIETCPECHPVELELSDLTESERAHFSTHGTAEQQRAVEMYGLLCETDDLEAKLGHAGYAAAGAREYVRIYVETGHKSHRLEWVLEGMRASLKRQDEAERIAELTAPVAPGPAPSNGLTVAENDHIAAVASMPGARVRGRGWRRDPAEVRARREALVTEALAAKARTA